MPLFLFPETKQIENTAEKLNDKLSEKLVLSQHRPIDYEQNIVNRQYNNYKYQCFIDKRTFTGNPQGLVNQVMNIKG